MLRELHVEQTVILQTEPDNASAASTGQGQSVAIEEDIILEQGETQDSLDQSDVSSVYDHDDEDLLENPGSRRLPGTAAARALRYNYTMISASDSFARPIEVAIDRDRPLLLDRPCQMLVVTGVVRCFGAQFDRKSGGIPIYPMMTHFRIPVEANEEAVVRLDFSGYDDDRRVQQRTAYFSEYNLMRAGADAIPVLEIPPAWTEARRQYLIERIARDSRARTLHICGRHARNRSLFFKFMLNSLFSQGLAAQNKLGREVYVLDLDAENPEFTLAGQVSLVKVTRPMIGPAYMNLAYGRTAFEVLRAHAIPSAGHRSYKQAFFGMIAKLRSLVDSIWYDHHMQNKIKPVVLIRHGHYAEPLLNSDLMHIIDSQDQLSLIYLVDRLEPHDVDDAHFLTEHGHEIITLKDTDEIEEEDDLKSIHLSIRHLRHLQQMSYFHHELSSKSRSHLWNDVPLSNRPVCELSYRAGEEDLAAVLPLFGQDPETYPDWLSQLINGMIVTIVVSETDIIRDPPIGLVIDRRKGDEIPFFLAADKMAAQPLDPMTSHVVGNALIRGIDVQCQVLEAVIPGHVLAALSGVPGNRIVLVAGCVEVPGWPQAEYLSWAKDNAGALNFVDIPAPWTSSCPSLLRKSALPGPDGADAGVSH